jgi:hypothetical protein
VDQFDEFLRSVNNDRTGVTTAPPPATVDRPAQSWSWRLRAWATRPARRREHRLVRADRDFASTLRRLPFLGRRGRGRIALRPGGRLPATLLWLLPALGVVVSLSGVATEPIESWLTVGDIAWWAALTVTVATSSWRRGPRLFAHELMPGHVVRLPGRPWSAAIVERVGQVNNVVAIDFHGGRSLMYEASREVATIRISSRLCMRWHYGATTAQRMRARRP